MKLLVEIKQKALRSKMTSLILITILEAQIISVLLHQTIADIYRGLIRMLLVFNCQAGSTLVYILINFALIAMFLVALLGIISDSFIGKMALNVAANCINIFPFILAVPVVYICCQAFKNQVVLKTLQGQILNGLLGQVLAGLAIGLSVLICLFQEYTNWSNRIIQRDFCNSRNNSHLNVIFIIVLVAVASLFQPFYASFVLILRSIYRLQRLVQTCDYSLVEQCQSFFSLFELEIATWCIIVYFDENNIQNSFEAFSLILVLSIIISKSLSETLIDYINTNFLLKKKSITQNQKDQGNGLPQNQGKIINDFDNNLRLTIKGILQKRKKKEGKPNQYTSWWRFLTQKIAIHKLNCVKNKCYCKLNQQQDDQNFCEDKIIIHDLQQETGKFILQNTKQIRLKILNIYLFNEISKKPLKSFYEIMRLKREKVNLITQIDLECLVCQTRECFDQIFKKNKVQNQELQLLKVISYEQLIDSLESLLKKCVQSVISFLYQFTYTSVKISAIQGESCKIKQLKDQFERILEDTITNYSENKNIQILIFVFYHFVEVYKSREAEFKKISNQQLMKKRIYQKSQVNIFNPENGSIYIDLIEDRGKIKKITKNLTEVFGYSREDMVSFNINLFMPRLYGRFHRRFLSNFIQKGQIKLLKQKQRVVFGKNKKKFIFPVNVRLKTEHLLGDQFGATALLTPIQTSSDFIMLSRHGKIEQMTQGIYKKIFKTALKQQTTKVSRLCFFKMLLGLMSRFQKVQTSYVQTNKISQGLLIFSQFDDILFQKFKHTKQNTVQSVNASSGNSTISASNQSRVDFSNSGSMSVSGLSQNSLASMSAVQQEMKIEYYSDLFKTFLTDINIFKLKGAKITYKISKLKTSEFQMDLIELTSFKQINNKKEFYLQVIYEFQKVAQILSINEAESPIMKHLAQLEEAVQNDNIEDYILLHQNIFERKKQKRSKNEKKSNTPQKVAKEQCTQDKYYTDQKVKKRLSLDQKSQIFDEIQNSDIELFQGEQQGKNLQLKGNSQQSSVVGDTQNQSKKQILVNAFNSKESGISSKIYYAANLIIVILLLLKVFLAIQIINFSRLSIELWNDNIYLQKLSQNFEFRLAVQQVQSYYMLKGIERPSYLEQQKISLNQRLTEQLKSMSNLTFEESLENKLYSYKILLQHPVHQTKMEMTFPQLFNYISWVFTQNDTAKHQVLLYNYETIHTQFNNFKLKEKQMIKQRQEQFINFLFIIFGIYQIGVLVLAIGALPLFKYFKNQQKFLLGLLSFMSVKQVNKLLQKLKKLNEYMSISKQSVKANKIQNQLNEKKFNSDLQAEGAETTAISRPIKITQETQDNRKTIDPKVFILLLVFIGFFSIISLSLLVLGKSKADFLYSSINVNHLDYDLENKSPLLLNVYFNQFNRILNGKPILSFSEELYDQTIHGYYQILSTIASKKFSENSITNYLYDTLTKDLCQNVDCIGQKISPKFYQNVSFIHLNMNLKNKFDYWHPKNLIEMNQKQVNRWIQENKIVEELEAVYVAGKFSQKSNQKIDQNFLEENKDASLVIILLIAIVTPLNTVLLFLIEYKFFNFLSAILKKAQDIYTNFHYSILIQNTYLTSYFNSKIKQNK